MANVVETPKPKVSVVKDDSNKKTGVSTKEQIVEKRSADYEVPAARKVLTGGNRTFWKQA